MSISFTNSVKGVSRREQGALIFVWEALSGPPSYQFMMNGLVALLLLFLLSPASTNQPLYAVSPELPPTAFLGQPYACQFQVTGLSSPVFTFKGLPRGFTWESSGMVKGTPAGKGSFAVTISFKSSSYKSSLQTLLRVAEPNDFPVNTNASSAQIPAFSISANIDTYVFMAGTQVSMQFSAVMGKQPYLWAYLRLPTELSGSVDGSLSGFFGEEGYFSFGVVVADGNGESAYCFITLNIQPLTFFTQWTPQALRPIADVPVRDYFSPPATQQAWKNYQAATQLLGVATQAASASKMALGEAQKNMDKMTYVLELAKQYLHASEQQLSLANEKRTQAEKFVNKTTFDLATANRTLGVKQSAFTLAQYSANATKKKLAQLQSICAKLSQLLNKASSDLSDAQNNLTAATFDLQRAQMGFNESQDNVTITLSSKDIASQQFQNVTVTSQRVFGDVDSARGEVDASKQSVAKAMDAFNLANNTAGAALQALTVANDNVTTLNRAASSAKNDLGQAQMKLALALSQLYVATAAKEQADKAMAIVSAQLTNTKNITFSGCSQNAYPSFFGSGQITSTIPQGFLVQSGQRLLLGSCTAGGGEYAVGNLVYFEGYLREGVIHLLKISKLTQN